MVRRLLVSTFLADRLPQTVRNLWFDGSLFKPSTGRSAATFLFTRDGLLRGNLAGWRAYRSPGFHPSQHDATLAERWLRDNAAVFSVVSG